MKSARTLTRYEIHAVKLPSLAQNDGLGLLYDGRLFVWALYLVLTLRALYLVVTLRLGNLAKEATDLL